MFVVGGLVAAARAEVVDRVIAVIGGQPLLASDLRLDAALAPIDPSPVPFWTAHLTALQPDGADPAEQLSIDAVVVRVAAADVALYQPTREAVTERVEALRVAIGGGDAWDSFLVVNGLDDGRVESAIRRRMVVERFLLRNLQANPADVPAWTAECGALLDQLRPRIRIRRIPQRIEEAP
ncbi:MAG: hypothetical protein ABMB14_22195 [Myxococcota bacterium]